MLTSFDGNTYAQLMSDRPPHLTLRICTEEPIELGDFVGAFTSIAGEYERFVRETHPGLSGSAQIFVKEVRAGSIEADLFPYIAWAVPFLAEADKVMLVEDFVRRWGGRITALIRGVVQEQPASRSELHDFTDAVQAIANDPNGSATLEAAVFEDGKREVRAAFKFTTTDARAARAEIDRRFKELESKSTADHERVLMVFARADTRDARVGKSSGELVKIEELSPKPLALIYASKLAEERIKHETRSPESIFKKGFVIDVNVRLANGKPAGYAVTHVHQVIDLPDDD